MPEQMAHTGDVDEARPEEGHRPSPQDSDERLRLVRTSLSRVHHDLSNPLAIISGNAQLLLELARLMDLGDDIIGPLTDIDQASRSMADSLYRLIVLKEMTNPDA